MVERTAPLAPPGIHNLEDKKLKMAPLNVSTHGHRLLSGLLVALGMSSGLAMAASTSLPVREVPNLQAFQADSTTLQQVITLLGQPASIGTKHSHQVVRWRGLTPASNEHSTARALEHTAARSAVSSTISHGLGKLFGSLSPDSAAEEIANDTAEDTAYQAGSEAKSAANRHIERDGNGQRPWTCTLYFSKAGTYQSGHCTTGH